MKAQKDFKDYKAVEVLGKNGKRKKVLQYFGDYYVFDLEQKQLRLRQRIMAVLAVLSAVSYIAGITRNIAPNRSGPISACGLIIVIPLFLQLAGSISFCFSKEKLTKNEYHEQYEYSKAGAAVTCVLQVLNAALRTGYYFLAGDPAEARQYLISILLFACSAALSGAGYGIIKKLTFHIIYGEHIDE